MYNSVSSQINYLDDNEIMTILRIRAFFDGWGSKKISEYSHKEEAYKKTSYRDFISYDHSRYLKIL